MINEFRRARRRQVADSIEVTDAMTDKVVGNIGNLSETGMLLIASVLLAEDALYQFRFQLHPRDPEAKFEMGAHLLWINRASAPGQTWTGFRFIAVPADQLDRLKRWIEAPGGKYD